MPIMTRRRRIETQIDFGGGLLNYVNVVPIDPLGIRLGPGRGGGQGRVGGCT